ncbi:hypothetical protein ACEPAH_1479 [Sanghuangporus vaninii]
MLSGPVNKKKNSRSSKALDGVLSTLAHLDLTDRIQYHGAVMKAHGGYCDVFVGSANLDESHALRPKRRGLVTVAIKRLRVHIQSDKDLTKLLRKELSVWSKLRHANILPLLGFVKEGDYPSVISEWMENGTVKQYMKSNPSVDPVPLIAGIAAGVRYLHMKNVVHSDLKADNVLVGHSGEPLICDFGISRILSHSLSNGGTSSASLKGSARWMAPELFNIEIDAHHTKETDMWAFGMTVYEILTQAVPYSNIRNDVQVIFAITEGKLPLPPSSWKYSPTFFDFAWNICEACWISPAEKRSTIKEVVSYLRSRDYLSSEDDSRGLGQERMRVEDPALFVDSGFGLDSGTIYIHGDSLFTQADAPMTGEELVALDEQAGYWDVQLEEEMRDKFEGPPSPNSGALTAMRSSDFVSPRDENSLLGRHSGRSGTEARSPDRVKKARRRHQRISSRHEFAFLDLLAVPPDSILRQVERHGVVIQSQFRALLQVNRRYPVNFLELGKAQFALGDETDSLFNALVRYSDYEGLGHDSSSPPYGIDTQNFITKS